MFEKKKKVQTELKAELKAANPSIDKVKEILKANKPPQDRMDKKDLEHSRKTIGEVMYEVGYSDVKAFREVFRKITGMSPLAYRMKYHNGALA